VLEGAKLFLNNRNKGDIRKHASFKDISFFSLWKESVLCK